MLANAAAHPSRQSLDKARSPPGCPTHTLLPPGGSRVSSGDLLGNQARHMSPPHQGALFTGLGRCKQILQEYSDLKGKDWGQLSKKSWITQWKWVGKAWSKYWKIAGAVKWKSACKQLLLKGVANVKGYAWVQKVENPSKGIKHKGPLLVQMPCPADQLLNRSLNMVNRERNGSILQNFLSVLENFRNYPSQE